MGSPIFSTRRITNNARRAFTLVEVMVGATLSTIILAGVISTFLLIGRTGTNLANYSDAEASARKALELFSREAHQAYSISGTSSTTITLGIPDNTSSRTPANPTANGAYMATYTFDTANKTLTRAVNSDPAVTLVTGVEQIPASTPVPFINYYKYVTAGTNPPPGSGYQDSVTNNITTQPSEVKQIEISFVIRRKNVTVTTASNKVISARFILRNK